MGGLMSRNKGKQGERDVRDLFRKAFSEYMEDTSVIRRNHQQAEIGGADLVEVPYYSVEVKRIKQIPWGKGLDDWWEQCVEQAAAEGKAPCLVFRQDRGQWFVMIWGYLTPSVYPVYPVMLKWYQFASYIKENFK